MLAVQEWWEMASPELSSSSKGEENNTAIHGSTLALVEARLVGGFRNQQMRLAGLIVHALQNNISNILVDSIFYDNRETRTNRDASYRGVPLESIIDIDTWNYVSDQMGTGVLPRLVRYAPDYHPQWNNHASLFHALNATKVLDPDKMRVDWYPEVQNCTQPFGFGSGIKSGRLWTTFQRYQKDQHGRRSKTSTSGQGILTPVEQVMAQAVQPSPMLSNLLTQLLGISTTGPHRDENNRMMVIHPRTETDMLGHRCAKRMMRNLTMIFDMLQEYEWNNASSSSAGTELLHNQVYLCISQILMDPNATRTGRAELRRLVEENYQRLLSVLDDGLWNGTIPVRLGGQLIFNQSTALPTPPPEERETAAQVLDFFVATRAHTFVGTFGSSFSNDVWTTRYVAGLGHRNFYHSQEGISPVPNGGLPPPHHC